MPGKTVLAYIAGFFDGEGCVMIAKHKRADGFIVYQLRVNISNTNKAILQLINTVFPSVIYEDKIHIDKRKKQWRYAAYDKKAEEFLKTLYPYLRIKRIQAEIAFNFRKTYAVRFRPLPKDIRGKRKDFRKQLHIVNQGGQINARQRLQKKITR